MNTKYRIWDYDNNSFDYIDLINIDKTIETFDSIRDYFSADYLQDNPNFLQRCTGIKDKNGEDIYLGDIMSDEKGNTVVILWDNGDAWFVDVDLEEYVNDNSSRVKSKKSDYIWVNNHTIGNIIENPELLDPR